MTGPPGHWAVLPGGATSAGGLEGRPARWSTGAHAASKHGRALRKNASAAVGLVRQRDKVHVVAGSPPSASANNGFSPSAYTGRGPAGVARVVVRVVVVVGLVDVGRVVVVVGLVVVVVVSLVGSGAGAPVVPALVPVVAATTPTALNASTTTAISNPTATVTVLFVWCGGAGTLGQGCCQPAGQAGG